TSTGIVFTRRSAQSSGTDRGHGAHDGSVVLDSNWRWLHSVCGYTNCYTSNE
ncbi:glycoside hydrolase family 7 protein, partial [Hydnomerulius pinastri MD-312]